MTEEKQAAKKQETSDKRIELLQEQIALLHLALKQSVGIHHETSQALDKLAKETRGE